MSARRGAPRSDALRKIHTTARIRSEDECEATPACAQTAHAHPDGAQWGRTPV